MSFPRVRPHDPIEQIGDDVFMARGSVNLNPVIRFTRNMAIIRHQGALTLVNPIRLSEAELGRLDALGKVEHVMRTSPFHGQDDPFYMDRYSARFWAQPGGTTYTEPPIDEVLGEGATLPFPGAELFCFRGTEQPESALFLTAGKGLYLSADAVQHYGDYSNCNFLARLLLPRIGFPKTTLVGPFWMKLMTPSGGSLRAEFDRLLEYRFDAMLSTHGTLLRINAHNAVKDAVARAYPV